MSVVISTHNRCDQLPAAIASVLDQQPGGPSFELIVVDNNSIDNTRRVVEELQHAAAGDGRLRYAFERRQGLSHGRNAGVARARGRIVAFTDDDVRVAPDWVAAIVRALDAHPDADFVGGRILPRWPADPPRWLTREHWAPLAISDFGDEPRYVDRSKPLCLVGASLAVRREVFDEFGGFDPAFQHEPGAVSAVEDHEFELRLWRAGRRGLYSPDICIAAEVQPNRLEKRYHRRWHSDHGRMVARLERADEHYDRSGALVSAPPYWLTLFGVPAWLYRSMAYHVAAGLYAGLLGRGAQAFWHETQLRESLGQMRHYLATRPRERHTSHLAEVGQFALALLRRRRSHDRLRALS
ncbi:MAG: glycosyltransferase [Gemmatimonadaceae bacterium]